MPDFSDYAGQLAKKLKDIAYSSGLLQQAAGTTPQQPIQQVSQDASVQLRAAAEENARRKRLQDALKTKQGTK